MVAGVAFLRGFLAPLLWAYLIINAAVRLGLWIAFREDSRVHVFGLLTALGAGAVNDCIEFLYLALPIAIVALFMRQGASSRNGGRIAVGIVSYTYIVVFIFTALAEVLFWEEFESRFNLIAVDYLIYPTEVLGNIRESYPVVPLLAGVLLLAVVLWLPVFRGILRRLEAADSPKFGSRGRAALAHVGAVALLGVSINAETLSLSSNRAVNELGKNGSATFFRAFLTQDIDYNQFYLTMPRARAYETLRSYYQGMGEVFASEDPTSLVRKHEANPSGLGKMNVVVLVQESLGAQFVGAYGDTRGLTTFLDTLSQESLMFSNAYATGTRTVRGLEAMSASFPPIPSESIVKRRGSDHISDLGAVMRGHGYSTSFLYGGYGAFDSMNAYFAGNDFACSDRLDIKNPQFGNIWGVSDEDLYRHAVGYFDGLAAAGGGPFFSFVLSTSNHKPFTFPPGIPGVPESGGGRLAGVRYADYAIGKFFEMAKTRPWFCVRPLADRFPASSPT